MKAKTLLQIVCFSIVILSLSYKSFAQCSPTYAAFPYTQTFDSAWLSFCGVSDAPDSNWTNSYTNNITIADTTVATWRRDDYSIWEDMYYNSQEWYSPPAAIGNYSARFHTAETIDSNGISSGNLDLHINLSSDTGIKVLSFYYINEAGYDNMTVYFSSDSGTTFDSIGSYTITSGWTQYILPINSNSPKSIIRFTGTSIEGYNGGDDIGLDYVQVYKPLNYNVSVVTQNVVLNPIKNYVVGTLEYPNYIQKNSINTVSGKLINYGGKTVTSINLNWSINGGKVNTTSLTSLNVAPFEHYNYTSTIPMVPLTDGNDTLKIWVDNINGSNPDENPSIDTLTTTFIVIDTILKKMTLLEDFGNASCDPCAEYMPNLDSVYQNSKKNCNIIRNHVDFPGRDFMNEETQSQVVIKEDLYGISSVPFLVIDGQLGMSTGEVTSPIISAMSFPGSPIKITGTYNYNLSTHVHTVTAIIKSFANFAAGFNLYAVIIDSLAYTKNQSQESIPQYYFPEVVEEILPNVDGDALAEFKDDTSQNVSYTWDQTHPLGADFSSFPYDSGNYAVVIFVQDPKTDVIYQSLAIPATVTTGIDDLNSGLTKVNAFPNPFNNNINLTLNLEKNEHIIVTVTDIFGREVLVSDQGSLNSGEHQFMYDASRLPSGIYLLKIQTDDGLLSLKIIKSN